MGGEIAYAVRPPHATPDISGSHHALILGKAKFRFTAIFNPLLPTVQASHIARSLIGHWSMLYLLVTSDIIFIIASYDSGIAAPHVDVVRWDSRQLQTMPDDQHTPVSKQQFPTFCPKSPTHLLL